MRQISPKLFFVLLAFNAYSHISAQQALPEDVLSPNAMDLGRYGDVSMNYFTGRANVTIPIFTTEQRGVALNINLSYDTGGLLMNSLPGWTGHGWTLNAGGCITRVQKGETDEYVFPVGYDTQYEVNTRDFRNYFQSSAEYQELIEHQPVNFAEEVRRFHLDSSPDIFVFNFMGKTGRFTLGGDKQWKVFCDENIDVVFDVNDEDNYIYPFIDHFAGSSNVLQPKTIKGFVLIDENGTRYIFGGEEEDDTDAIEYSNSLFTMRLQDNQRSFTANVWYLRKVIDRYGKLLYEFTYQRGKYIIPLNIAYEYRKTSLMENCSSFWRAGMTYDHTFASQNAGFPYSAVINSPVYLTEIRTGDGKQVKFLQSSSIHLACDAFYPSLLMYENQNGLTQALANACQTKIPNAFKHNTQLFPCLYSNYGGEYANYANTAGNVNIFSRGEITPLESILIQDLQGNTVRSFHFCYSISPRLHLTDLELIDGIGQFDSKYRFVYDQYDRVPSDYTTTCTDHWGYYNNSSYSLANISSIDKLTFINRKHVNPQATKYGSLTAIIYPTGGMSVFEYEQNEYGRYMSEDRQTVLSLSTMGPSYSPTPPNHPDNPNNPDNPGQDPDQGGDEEAENPEDAIYSPDGKAGGLRVKSITEYDDTLGINMLKRRTFSYLNPENDHESGVLFAQPRYFWIDNVIGGSSSGSGGPIVSEYTFRASSIVPLSNQFGPFLGYSYVTEHLNDGTRCVYHYSNVSDEGKQDEWPYFTAMDSIVSAYTKYEERDYLRGKLISVEKYDSFGTLYETTCYNYQLLSDCSNELYASNFVYIDRDTVRAVNVYGNEPTPAIYVHPFGVIYKMSFPKYNVNKIVKSITTDGESIIQTTGFANTLSTVKVNGGYPHLQRVLKVTSDTITRNSDIVINRYDYPHDSTSVDTCFTRDFYLPLRSHSTVYNGNTICRTGTLFGWFSAGEDNIFAPAHELQAKRDVNGCCTEENDTLISYLSYTSEGRLKQYAERGKVTTNYVWNVVHDRMLAKVQKAGAAYQLEANSAATNPYGSISLGGNSVFCYPETNSEVYTYNSFGNVASVTTGNGQTMYYEYDTMGRLCRVRDTNGKTVREYEFHYSASVNNN